VVGDKSKARHLLEEKMRELGEGVLVVMGSHGRTGVRRLFWGSKAEEVVRDFVCPVLVVKAPAAAEEPITPAAEATAGA
jgi:nucleotide-binding universal stress UspA family protein